jgi:hypothetical protein
MPRFFGHLRPDGNGGFKPSPVQGITREQLGSGFGADRKHRLIVSLEAGDLLVFRPERTSRPVTAKAADVYRWILLCRANSAQLERARARKAAKAARLARQRQERAERRLFAKP